MKRFDVGDIRIHLLDDGCFQLDGGGMFGVVPRAIWEKHMPPNGHNQVQLGLICPLIESNGRRVLVDTGIGRRHSPKKLRILGIDSKHTLLDSLKELGLSRDSIDVVTNTHLHFDHSGWNTFEDASGSIVPTFANAQYVFQREEWETAQHPDARSAPAYPRDNFEPLRGARELALIEGEQELAVGVFTQPTPGHTCGHQCVRIESQGETAIFLGDLIPTPAHLPITYHMSYDLYPLELMATKRELLERAARERWLLIFDHDPEQRVGRVRFDQTQFEFHEL